MTRGPRTSQRIEVGATVAGLPAGDLLERYGSPLYVYDAAVIRARAARLRAALPAGVDVAFATKANPSPGVLQVIAAAGLGADVASGGELRAVLRAGVSPERIVFTGPGKTDAELEAALASGHRRADHRVARRAGLGHRPGRAGEAGPGAAAAAGHHGEPRGAAHHRRRRERQVRADRRRGRRGHRAAPRCRAAGRRVAHAGCALPPARLPRLRRLQRARGGRPRAGCRGPGAACRAAGRAPRPAPGAARRRRRPGHPLCRRRGAARPARARGGAGRRAGHLGRAERRWPAAVCSSSPAAGSTGPAGAYLCRVVRTKERGGRHVAVMDGGIHHLLRPRLVGQDHRVVAAGEASGRPSERPCGRRRPALHRAGHPGRGRAPAAFPQRGDIYAVLDAGAYGFSESMPFFLSHPIPAEIVVDGGGDVSRSCPRPERRRLQRRPASRSSDASGAPSTLRGGRWRHAAAESQRHRESAQPRSPRRSAAAASSACTRRGAVPPMTSGRARALSSSAAARSVPGTAASAASPAATTSDEAPRTGHDVRVGQPGQLDAGGLRPGHQ